MQNSINTILLTTDFTEKSQNALLMALNIASRHHSRLIVLHNIDNFFVIDKTGKQLLGADVVKDNVQRAENALRQNQSIKTAKGFHFSWSIRNTITRLNCIYRKI